MLRRADWNKELGRYIATMNRLYSNSNSLEFVIQNELNSFRQGMADTHFYFESSFQLPTAQLLQPKMSVNFQWQLSLTKLSRMHK